MRGSRSSKEVGRRPWCDGMATVLPTSTPSMDRRWVSATGSNDVWLTSCRSCDYVMFQGDLRHYDGISWSSELQSDDMGRAVATEFRPISPSEARAEPLQRISDKSGSLFLRR